MKKYINNKIPVLLVSMLLFIIFGCGYQLSFAAEHQVSIDELIGETQKSSIDNGQMLFVWWIPLEFWQTAFNQTEVMTKADQEFVLSILRPYTLVAVMDGISEGNRVKYKKENEIRDRVELIDGFGNKFLPLDNSEISTGVVELLKKFKPMVGKLTGIEAKNFYFILFTSQAKDEKPMYDPLKKGTLFIKLESQLFKWRLPLNSLVPAKKCPTCAETLSGSYQYCPWDGTKLPE